MKTLTSIHIYTVKITNKMNYKNEKGKVPINYSFKLKQTC